MMHLVLLGLLMTAGFIAGVFGERWGIPRVATYILVGALFSGDLLGTFIDIEIGAWSTVLTEIALGIIVFIVGSEVEVQWIRSRWREVVLAVVGQSLGAVLMVGAGIWLYTAIFSFSADPMHVAVILAAIASATAPAATVAIIEEYRAQGPLTAMLLSIVAIDDALAVIYFALAMSVVGVCAETGSLLPALRETGGAVILGAVLGAVLGWYARRIHADNLRLPLVLGFVLLTIGSARFLGFSLLLACMTLGFVSKSFYRRKTVQWLHPMEAVQETIFLIFFTLAGIHFEFGVFADAFFFIALYILLRAVGKYGGAWAGTKISDSPAAVTQNVGLGLLPQAGVATGLALQVQASGAFPDAALILNTILGSTIVFELLAPWTTKLALFRAGEAGRRGAA